MFKKIPMIFLLTLLSISIFSIPKPILYISFDHGFEPDIMNTRFTFEPKPKLFGNPRIINGALFLNGVSFLRYRITDLLDYNAFTVSLWIKPKKIGTFDRVNWYNVNALFHLRDSHDLNSEWGISICRDLSSYYLFVMYPARHDYQGWIFECGKNLLDDDWHNVVFMRDGRTLTMYLDGKEIGRQNLRLDQEPTSFRSFYLYIGAAKRVGSRGKFRGFIDDVAVWNTALSQSDVLNIYRNGGIGKEVENVEIDLNKAKAKLREAYNSGKISNDQLRRALDELTSGKISRLLRDFILGVISVDDFAALY